MKDGVIGVETSRLPQQLRQLGDAEGEPPGLVAGEEFSEISSEQQLSQISEPYELCRPVLALPLRCNAGRDDSQYGC